MQTAQTSGQPVLPLVWWYANRTVGVHTLIAMPYGDGVPLWLQIFSTAWVPIPERFFVPPT
ncbi:MAG: hypothetical protein Fur005_34730 [Roseiflexaceae bacterium]